MASLFSRGQITQTARSCDLAVFFSGISIIATRTIGSASNQNAHIFKKTQKKSKKGLTKSKFHAIITFAMRVWRNWQTRKIQVLMGATL